MPRISFDRVADVYDATRGHPPEVSQAVAASVAALLPPDASILEVGIGTGRIARPLMARGIHVAGIDLSPYMMKRLLESLPPGAARPLVAQADAVWLPFPAAIFQAVTSIHVFHLIAEWQQSLREIMRVLQPGGIFLTGFDWRDKESPASQINDQWRAIISPYVGQPGHPGPKEFDDVEKFLAATGARMEEWEVARWETTLIPSEYIRQIEAGVYSYSWRLAPERVPACAAMLRQWAVDRFDSLDAEFTILRKFIWQKFTWS